MDLRILTEITGFLEMAICSKSTQSKTKTGSNSACPQSLKVMLIRHRAQTQRSLSVSFWPIAFLPLATRSFYVDITGISSTC